MKKTINNKEDFFKYIDKTSKSNTIIRNNTYNSNGDKKFWNIFNGEMRKREKEGCYEFEELFEDYYRHLDYKFLDKEAEKEKRIEELLN